MFWLNVTYEVNHGCPRGKDQGWSSWHQKATTSFLPISMTAEHWLLLTPGSLLIDRKTREMPKEVFTGYIICSDLFLLSSHICLKATSLKGQTLLPTFSSYIGVFPRSNLNLLPLLHPQSCISASKDLLSSQYWPLPELRCTNHLQPAVPQS